MRIEAQPHLIFWVSFNLREIDVLMQLSSNHYDSRCRSYSGPDGLLARCQRVMRFNIEGGQTDMALVRHSFLVSDCDTVAKITEMGHYLPNQRDRPIANRLHILFVRACQTFNDYYNGHETFEVLP